MNLNSKIYVAGHNGMVGSAILRLLIKKGYSNLIYKSKDQLNLLNEQCVTKFFQQEKPEYVYLAAAKVGGINANNKFKGQFIYENLQIQSNIIHQSYLNKVKKLIFLGSSCIYPKMSKQPIKEEYLLSGLLEPTNRPYAVAKIAGIELCKSYNFQYGCNFISVMPTNLYGPNDNYDLDNSHVLPALIRKFIEAKKNNTDVTLWGSGKPKREFLHVDDLADACLFLMKNYDDSEIINIGSGEEISILKLANLISEISDFDKRINWDFSKPDGTPRKLLDSSKLNNLGWSSKIKLEDGIKMVFNEMKNYKF